MKRPAFQFYPADWRKDPALSSCSLAARGLWIELLCVAHESDDYGHLTVNGNAMTDVQVARAVGEAAPIVRRLLVELEHAGVFSRDGKGSIFSRRMERDERLRSIRAECGKLGGNPVLVKQRLKRQDKQDDKQTPTPSVSSSSSSSNQEQKPPRKRAARSLAKVPLPDEFTISERVREWAADKGYDRLELYLEAFIGKAKANGYRYIDWDDAFMNSIREDWGKIREQKRANGKQEGGAWWESDAGMLAKGKELDLAPYPGESWPQFKGRINQRINAQRGR